MAVDFVGALGMKLDDWEEYVLWAVHDIDERNRWAASEFGALVSRQNGKSEILCAYDLCRLFLFPLPDLRRRTVLHTAHEVKTATESFEKVQAIIEGSAQLMPMVKHIYTGNGKAVLLHTRPGQLLGDRLMFIARSRNSGRGFFATDIVFDEAQELAAATRSALTYTTTTVPNRQELYFGTAPLEENNAEVFEGVRDRGRAKKALRTGWMEWSPAGSEDPKLAAKIDPWSHDVWRQGIPALGIWIEPETVLEQVERGLELDREALLADRFSVWPARPDAEAPVLSKLDLEQFRRNALPLPLGDGPVLPAADALKCIALAVGPGGQFATVALGTPVAGDGIFVEHTHTEAGTRWVAAYLKTLKAAHGDALIVLDAKNASVVITSLQTADVTFLTMNLDELAAAHSLFIELSNAGFAFHRGQPEVVKSLQFASTRALGRAGLTWEPSDPTKPIAHAQAVTWALWGVTKAAAMPPKKPATVRGYA
jgi:hypothetical protein